MKKIPLFLAMIVFCCGFAESLKGIRILGSWDQIGKKLDENFSGVASDRVFLLGAHPEFLKQLEYDYVNRPIDQEAIANLKNQIIKFYRAYGQPFAIVSIPKQDLDKAVLQIVVHEAILGNVSVKGNHTTNSDYLRHFIQTKAGQLIDSRKLVQDMARMNQNPFRRTDAILRPGVKPGTADLELATIERWPYRFYMGADNTGTIATERDRLFFGLNLGKTIVDDSEVSYQFTCSPNWNLFNAQTALCRIPFPARQTFIFYGGYSQVQPALGDGESEKSQSWQVDGRYRIPIITNTSFLQEFLLGYDFKQVIGRVKTDGVLVFKGIADINQFMVGYDLGYKDRQYRLTLIAELYGNPGGITTHNDTSDYQPFQEGAGSQYVYFKFSHSLAYQIHDWCLSYDINGQIASKKLLPSEQFTLSGYNAVRGFEERIVNVNNAFLLNLTAQTPRVSIGKLAGWSKRSFDELYFLLFIDYGLGGYHDCCEGNSATASLASMGAGIRYQIDRYLTARFDYGVQLFHHGFYNPTDSRYNFGLMVSF